MKPTSIICPKCQNSISLDDALSHQYEELNATKLEEEKIRLRKEMQEWQKEQNSKREKELQEAREMELKLRKEKNQLEDDKKAFELKIQRQLDEDREKIRKTAEEAEAEKHRLLEAEKNKQIEDMKKTIEELQQKANQGSQQTQGEVLELEIENNLKNEFPTDEISPVGKGVNGADVIQRVRDNTGRVAGIIVWESKRTKNWDKNWPGKLKEDLMRVKGDVAVLISIALPDEVKNFGYKEGIYVTSFECFLQVALILRKALIEQQKIKSSVVGKNEKMEMVYNYFLSSEFRQRVEAIAEAFSSMKADLENEKRVFAKMWAKREKEIEKVIHNTVTMHGDLQGLMGQELPVIESLEPEALIEEPSSQSVLFEESKIAES